MNFLKHLPRLAAAALFAASASTAVVVADATHAGQPANGLLASAPQVASAYVSIGVGINIGHPSYRYSRFAYRGGAWVPYGYAYAPAPGYINGYYLGYSAPAYGYYPRGFVRPGYAYGYGHSYYGRGYAHPYARGPVGYNHGYDHGYAGYRR